MNLNQDYLSKNPWKNCYKIKFLIISFKNIVELPNFGHIITFTISLLSCDEILLITLAAFITKSQSLFQNTVILRKLGIN